MTKAILLKNKTVPVDPYYSQFINLNWNVEFFPILEHEPVDSEGLREYLESNEFHSLDGIIITSQRAVEALNANISKISEASKTKLLQKPIYTVGPATAKVLKEANYSDVRGGNQAGNGDILSDLIIKQYKGSANPLSNFVFFTGVTRRDIIPIKIKQTNGMSLIEKIVYKTKPIDNIRTRIEDVISTQAETESPPWIIFFSPANTEDIVEALKLNRNKFRIAVIGPTTEQYLKLNDLEPDSIAEKPDANHLIKAILGK